MKILLVSWHGFAKNSGTGITFSSVLSEFSNKNISQVFGRDPEANYAAGVESWRLGPRDVFLRRNATTEHFVSQREVISSVAKMRKSSSLLRNQGCIRKGLRAWADLLPVRFSNEFCSWAREWAPDIILGNLGTIRWIQCTKMLSDLLAAPVVLYINDDWPSTLYRGNLVTAFPRLVLCRAFRGVLKRTIAGMAASDAMAEEYSIRFKKPFMAFMHCVDVDRVYQPPSASLTHDIRFAYVGGLHLDRWQNLVALGQQFDELNKNGLPVSLDLYVPRADAEEHGEKFKALGSVRVVGNIAYHEVSSVLRRYDVLVHVESFKAEHRKYTRLSLSTKIPQYLAAGRPILAWGPMESGSCAYLARVKAGIVIGDEHGESLRKCIQDIAVSEGEREALGRNALMIADSRHRADIQAKRAREFLKTSLKS